MNHLTSSHYTCLRGEHTSHPRSSTISGSDESAKRKRKDDEKKMTDEDREVGDRSMKIERRKTDKKVERKKLRRKERQARSFNGQVEAAASCEVTT